jgi:hypothetical protein
MRGIKYKLNSRQILKDETFLKLIDEFKFKICEDTFGEGNFNFELFQYALEKIFEEERKIQEEEEERVEASKPKVSWFESISKSSFLKYFTGGVVLLSIGSIGVHYYLYSSSAFNSHFK